MAQAVANFAFSIFLFFDLWFFCESRSTQPRRGCVDRSLKWHPNRPSPWLSQLKFFCGSCRKTAAPAKTVAPASPSFTLVNGVAIPLFTLFFSTSIWYVYSLFPKRWHPKWLSKDETRNGYRNSEQNPELSKFRFLFKWTVWKETYDDRSLFQFVFRSTISSIVFPGQGCTTGCRFTPLTGVSKMVLKVWQIPSPLLSPYLNADMSPGAPLGLSRATAVDWHWRKLTVGIKRLALQLVPGEGLDFSGINRFIGIFLMNLQETRSKVYRRKDTLGLSKADFGILQTQLIDGRERPLVYLINPCY